MGRKGLNPLAGDGPVLSVMNYERREATCGGCGIGGVVLFNAMDCRARGLGGGAGTVVCRCKGCLVEYAREKEIVVYLKTTCKGLGEVWRDRTLPKPPVGTEKGLAALRARREAEGA